MLSQWYGAADFFVMMTVKMRQVPWFLLAAVAAVASPADRRVAEFTLTMGGRVAITGNPARIVDIASLPKGDFTVEVLDWVGMNVDPQDLERLTGLRSLKELHLPGPLWNRNADGGRDGSTDLKYLAPISTLEAITFSYHFLDNVRFRDAGLGSIKELVNMRELVLRQSNVKGHELAPFRNLEAFDCTLCPFDDTGLDKMSGMVRMKRLWIGDTNITDSALAAVATMTALEDLDLHGTAITDAGLAHLKGLTRLRKLNLMGLNVTDAGLRILTEMKNLEQLNLYRTKVTNAGIAQLAGLRRLAEVDLRYSRVTRGAVDSLAKSLPSTRFVHLELSARPKPKVAVDTLSGQAWIKALGGRYANGELVLSGTAVTDSQLAKLAGLGPIRTLNLEATEVGDAGMRHLAALNDLEKLVLSSTSVSDVGLAQVQGLRSLRRLALRNTYVEGAGLAGFEGLEELDLSGSPVPSGAVEAIGKLPRLRRLTLASTDVSDGVPLQLLTRVEALDLQSTDLTDKGLEGVKQLTNLRTLVLRDSRMTDGALAHLAGLDNLQSLDLGRTRISDAGMVLIGKMVGLRSLVIDYAEVHDAGLAHLAKLTNLESLSLDNTHVTDRALPLLKQLPALRQLNLYHTLVSAASHAELKAALPNCKIVWDEKSNLPNRRRS